MVNMKQYQKQQALKHVVSANPSAPKKSGLDAVREEHAKAVANAPKRIVGKPKAFTKVK